MPRDFVQQHAVARDIGEEVAAPLELMVHVLQAVDDEVHWRAQLGPIRQRLQEPRLGCVPELRGVGEILLVDHDQQIVIGEIAPDRVFHPIVPGIGAEENNLQHLAVLQPLLIGSA